MRKSKPSGKLKCWNFNRAFKGHSLLSNCRNTCLLLLICFSINVIGQEAGSKIAVKGKVLASNGEAKPFVTILEKGTSNAALTDIDGNFKINVESDKSVLVFSYVGSQPQEVVVGNQKDISITMKDVSKMLETVTIVGYGQVRSKDVTGATATVSNKDLKDRPVVDFSQALQGKAAGVEVTSGSNGGQPGGGTTIKIRGVGTINSTEPLVVVDGFPIEGGLSAIDPNTIDRVDILKDASSAAIYGARGANGVIIVTTKKGTKGMKPQINFNTYHGLSTQVRMPKLLNASQYAQFHVDMMQNAGKGIGFYRDFQNPSKFGEGTDWLSNIFQQGKVDYYQMDLLGASDKNRYLISSSYLKNEGTIIKTAYERINFQINNTTEVNDNITFGTTNTIAYENYKDINPLSDALNILPIIPVIDPVTGDYGGPDKALYGNTLNPVGRANKFSQNQDKYRLLSNIYGEIKFLKNFKFRTQLGADISYTKKANWTPTYAWGKTVGTTANFWQSRDDNMIGSWENTLSYDKTIKENHKITAMVGYSTYASKSEYFNGQKNTYVSDQTQTTKSGLTPYSLDGTYSEYAMLSYFSRITYGFKDKYLATINVRRDYSSRFGANYRYGDFPSGSVAWRISNEDFFEKYRGKINELKLRLGYGINGNQNIGGNYSFANKISDDLKYNFNGTIVSGAGPTSLANPNVHWEETRVLNAGLDVSFFDDRLAFNADYYIKNTYGMLQQQQVAGFIGLPYDKPYVNIGEMKNTGFELSLSGTVLDNKIREKTFKWVAAFNISFNQNTVVKLYQSTPRYTNIGLNSQPAITQEGDPYGTFYGWVTDGVFQNQNDIDKHAKQTGAAPGDIRFKDLNGDGVIDDKDRTTLGSPFPKFNYGFTNTFSFYNFDLTVFIQGVSGNKIYNFNRQVNEAMSSVANQYATVLDRWTGEGTSNSMPRAVYADPNGNSRVSDRFIEDGSYIRLQNLQITYNLPEGMLSKIHMRLLSVYLSSQNLVTLTKYSGFSPDIGNYTGSGVNFYSPGIDFGLYPNPRTITIGAKLGF